ncbi:hypothetical protein SteCoe_14425 [Stentor coeruleus]|uniref:FCP1 homology domain-containing protein n=1 Tax=Stentor coeruleus TaxID=5963 RepID=A0A1R2C660_9CILI|nr:hypothetical protein SteCoe_14425 [Stentor coeruleus]
MSLDLVFDTIFQCSSLSNNSKGNFKNNLRVLPAITRSSHKRTLVLDLDETLVHSSEKLVSNPDATVVLSSENNPRTLYVKFRPGLMEFLNKVLKFFELVIYTASSKEYAEQVINAFDPQRKILKYRLYREDCIQIEGHFVKDLSRLGRDLSKIIIVDNSVTAFAYHLDNGIPIVSWFDDPNDCELHKVGTLLEKLINTHDVRPVLNSIFNLPKIIRDFKESVMAN